MLILVKETSGKSHKVEVETSDTIDELKRRLEGLTGISADVQRLIFSGKQLEDGRNLANYNILPGCCLHMVVQLRGGHHSSRGPSESIFSGRESVKANLQAWKSLAKEGSFDEDTCIVDPQAHFDQLSWLEKDTVESSEFFNDRGAYADVSRDQLRSLCRRRWGLQVVPEWMWPLLQEAILDFSGEGVDGLAKFNENSQRTLISLWTSYIVLCRVLESFDTLREAGFCGSFYSILLELPEKPITKIMKVARDALDGIKSGIEIATVLIWNGETHPEAINSCLRDCIQEPCAPILDSLGLRADEFDGSTTSILGLCRSISLLADLGLVSYVGSHASRFDLEFLKRDIQSISVVDEKSSSLHFDCKLRRLACLDEFLDKDKVWVFRCDNAKSGDGIKRANPDARLFILTHLEEFADLWGPVWSMPADYDSPRLIKHHIVSKGVICRVDESNVAQGSPVRCHWYDEDSYYQRIGNPLVSRSPPLCLLMDDLLLIGARFRENESCKYTLNQFEATYGLEWGVLGCERSLWKRELDSREGGFSFTKVIGVSVSGTQKKRPQTSLKQHILSKLNTSPQTINPGFLNEHLGVEVSHCTGNARRVRIKDLLLAPCVLLLLELQFPRWANTSWGRPFLAALRSQDPGAVFDVWMRYRPKRCDMAALVCHVLQTLDKTGYREEGFAVGFFNNWRERVVHFAPHRNDWSGLLRDSPMMATYAVVTNVCIECHTPDHSTSICGDAESYTVLRTHFGLDVGENFGLIKMKPHGQILRNLENTSTKSLLLMPASSASTAGAHMLSSLPSSLVASGIEVRDEYAQGGHIFEVFLRASKRSYGGMKSQRERLRSDKRTAVPQNGTAVPTVASLGTTNRSATPGASDQPIDVVPRRTNEPEPGRSLAPTPPNLNVQEPNRQTETSGTAPLRRLYDDDVPLHTVPPNAQIGTRTATAYRPSDHVTLLDDMKNYGTNDYEESQEEKSLIDDIYNYCLDDK